MRSLMSVCFAIGIGLVACVGDEPISTPAPASTPTPATPTNDGGSSNVPDAAEGSDGSASSPDGAIPTKRSINCDKVPTPCTGADLCCGGGNNEWTGASCKPDCGGSYSLRCDDAADCAGGEVCCYKSDGGARAVASYCKKGSCDTAQERQLCGLSLNDCVTGSCLPLTQFAPGNLARCE